MSLRNIKQALKSKVKTGLTTAMLEGYKKFLKVFNLEAANNLQPHRPGINYTIYMQPGT